MELSTKAIREAVHPTAAYLNSHASESEAPATPATLSPPSWGSSLLNPKNRIDSCEAPRDPLWRIDGCTGLGTQFYAVPLFLSQVRPMRMDVFIPEDQPPLIRRQLDLGVAFHTKDAERLSRLAITQHIVRTLQLWTTRDFENLDAFANFYTNLPFGSRLVFETLTLDIHQIQVTIGPNHNLERQLLPISRLRRLWGTEFPLPQEVDFDDVHVVAVLHDSVCLARIHDQLVIFKALTSGPKYLYHELKILCGLKPHPSVIAHPLHIVTKTCKFGGKIAVVGFTTFYHQNGSLRDVLPQLRIHQKLHLVDQMKWATQLTTALEHLKLTSGTYYPDLRLDNIVLSKDMNVVMVDFEQRGVWCEFAAPEVNSAEYVRLLAVDEEIAEEVTEKCRDRLTGLVPDFEELEGESYNDPPHGYNLPWIALSPVEQEAAEVYMLGRLLWCIFEGVSGPQKAAVWQSYRWEPELEFPEYRRTPLALRDLIDRCTRGRRETLSSVAIRQGSRLVLRDQPSAEQEPRDVIAAARTFWQREIRVAEDFLDKRNAEKQQGSWQHNYYQRPALSEVLAELKLFEASLSESTP